MCGVTEQLLRDSGICVSDSGVSREPCVFLWSGICEFIVRIMNFGVEERWIRVY